MRVALRLGMLKRALLLLLGIIPLSAASCAVETQESDDETEEPPAEQAEEELRSVVDCTPHTETAYVSGKAHSITTITVGGKRVTKATGHAFLKMQRAADAAGVRLALTSGFRTMDEQKYLYNCYLTKRCNNGNLAARPGYSNHQSGTAVDLTTSSWLAAHAGEFGFVRTVPSEAWHYEYRGSDPGGVCGGGASTHAGCYSSTLGKDVVDNTCVQARSDRKWYQCKDGAWVDRYSDPEACVSQHPL
jgi:hypothetical protein